MTDDKMTAAYGNALVIRARISTLLGDTTATDADKRLTRFTERLLRVIAGTPESETDAVLAEALDDDPEPWRYDLRAERMEIVLEDGLRLVRAMREERYASLPQKVRDADAAAEAVAAKRRAGIRAALGLPVRGDPIDA